MKASTQGDSNQIHASLATSLISQVPLGILMFAPSGELLHVNDLAIKALHLQDQPVLHMHLEDICQQCHNLNPHLIRQAFLGHTQQERVQNLHVQYFPVVQTDGSVWASITLTNMETVTLQVAGQTPATAETLFEISPDCLKFLDASGRLLRMNANGMRLMQIDDFAALQGQQWVALWPEDAHPALLQSMQDALNGKIGRFQGFCPTARGQMRCWDVVVMPIMEGHRVTGMVAASRDITETAELERKNREISDRQEQFINDAAHELKTPLAAIQGNLDVLLRYEDIPEEEKKEILQDVHHSATRLSRLVSNMLQLARADTAISLDEEVPLHAVVHSAWREVQRIAPGHQFATGDIQSIELYGNTDRLKQMTLILLENAVKYTPAGGRIHVSLQQEDQQAILTVQDSGIGIAPEHHHKVFERFFRVDRTRVDARDPGGSGLGLPIARWIVEAHGGQVFLESALGQGSTFKVVLPLEALDGF